MREVGVGGAASDKDAIDGERFVVPLLVSDVIPSAFRHGFSTRAGGVSAAPFDSLNLGSRWGDERAAVAENWRRLAAVAGREIHVARQVHGRTVVRVTGDMDAAAVRGMDADALITNEADVVIGVLVADCVPILMADPRTGAVAAVHAGWRGTVAGIVEATMDRMRDEFGSDARELRVAVGPSIGPCCFEVGAEVVSAVEQAFPDARDANAVIERLGAKPHIDLWALAGIAARRRGVPPAQIETASLCTRCDVQRFFSYRRDRGVTGQQAAFIRSPRAI